MKETICYLSLGSNSGDSVNILLSAMEGLSSKAQIVSVSSLYRTSPVILTDQAHFFNCGIAISWLGGAYDLLTFLNGIEANHGRDRDNERKKGPRTLDIDIIFYGDEILSDSKLTVPHYDYKNRKFVLVPLLEMNPGLVDPMDNTPLRSYLDALEKDTWQGIYRINNPHYNAHISRLRNAP